MGKKKRCQEAMSSAYTVGGPLFQTAAGLGDRIGWCLLNHDSKLHLGVSHSHPGTEQELKRELGTLEGVSRVALNGCGSGLWMGGMWVSLDSALSSGALRASDPTLDMGPEVEAAPLMTPGDHPEVRSPGPGAWALWAEGTGKDAPIVLQLVNAKQKSCCSS